MRPLTLLGHRTRHAAKQIVSARTNPFRLHCGLTLVAASPASADAALPLPRHVIRRRICGDDAGNAMMLRGQQRPEAVQHRALWPGSREGDRLRAVGGTGGSREQLGYLSGEIEEDKHN